MSMRPGEEPGRTASRMPCSSDCCTIALAGGWRAHTQTGNGSCYRYYITHAQKRQGTNGNAVRVPAHELEQMVIQRLRDFLRDDTAVQEATDTQDTTAMQACLDQADRIRSALREKGAFANIPPKANRRSAGLLPATTSWPRTFSPWSNSPQCACGSALMSLRPSI